MDGMTPNHMEQWNMSHNPSPKSRLPFKSLYQFMCVRVDFLLKSLVADQIAGTRLQFV